MTAKTDAPKTPPGEQNAADARRQLHIARELADTTWRIAVPVIGLTILGIIGDRSWGTKPWLTLLGSILGFVFASLLVKRQINRVTKEEENAQ
jgi:F0F1-type ATP synthase assembly protein I